MVGPNRQTRAAARAIAVNFVHVTLNNIKIAPVSDAFLAQHNHGHVPQGRSKTVGLSQD